MYLNDLIKIALRPDAAAKEADEEGPDIKKKVFFTINYYGGVIVRSTVMEAF